MRHYIYFPENFTLDLRDVCGNKAIGLWEMIQLGISVPYFFTISTEVCRYYYDSENLPDGFDLLLLSAIKNLELITQKKFGDDLLVSARSGSTISMPGMMDTVLNIKTFDQLKDSIIKVIKSYMSERAISYRKANKILDNIGTSITIQEMVLGNINGITGVMFSRDPSTGAKELYGEFLANAQGEELVSGTKTPIGITENAINEIFPILYNELRYIANKLEHYYKDVQDIEFTVENGKLFVLQTRAAKRTISATVKIAYDMLQEGLISEKQAIAMVDPSLLDQLLHPMVDYTSGTKIIGHGLSASPGGATGILIFSSEKAIEISKTESVILVRNYTSPDDINGVYASQAVITCIGGMTSHAAVVTRGIGKPCVCGLQNAIIDEEDKILKINDHILKEGDQVTIDGSSGNIILGTSNLILQEIPKELDSIIAIADRIAGIKVRANADNLSDISRSLKLGACGIGLCRTEHMMFEPLKLSLFRQYICNDDSDKKAKILLDLRSAYENAFVDIFRELNGLPIGVRLLDPPLNEFLSLPEHELHNFADSLDIDLHDLKMKLASLKEENPMLGHRGCRLGITHPEIYSMQMESICLAARTVDRQQVQTKTKVEITIPFISTTQETKFLIKLIRDIISRTYAGLDYKIGIMIELPRAVLISDQLATLCDYFTFGTNDLTQTTYGISRDDMSSFIHTYKLLGIIDKDPFIAIDKEGVGRLIQTAIQLGRSTNPNLTFGVCGEHGGDPESIKFFKSIGIDYVSCSSYRIRVAKLAACE